MDDALHMFSTLCLSVGNLLVFHFILLRRTIMWWLNRKFSHTRPRMFSEADAAKSGFCLAHTDEPDIVYIIALTADMERHVFATCFVSESDRAMIAVAVLPTHGIVTNALTTRLAIGFLESPGKPWVLYSTRLLTEELHPPHLKYVPFIAIFSTQLTLLTFSQLCVRTYLPASMSI